MCLEKVLNSLSQLSHPHTQVCILASITNDPSTTPPHLPCPVAGCLQQFWSYNGCTKHVHSLHHQPPKLPHLWQSPTHPLNNADTDDAPFLNMTCSMSLGMRAFSGSLFYCRPCKPKDCHSHQDHLATTVPLHLLIILPNIMASPSSPWWQVSSASLYLAVQSYTFFSSTPCDKEGIYLPCDYAGSFPPPPPQHADDTSDNWTLYWNHVEFKMAEFLYCKAEMSAANIDTLLDLWGATLYQSGGSCKGNLMIKHNIQILARGSKVYYINTT